MPLLFAYGTLCDHRVQQALFGRRLAGESDRLHGYVRVVVDIGDGAAGYPNVERTGNGADVVWGEVLDVSDEELQAADVYETAAYRREVVTLASGTSAWIYIAAAPVR